MSVSRPIYRLLSFVFHPVFVGAMMAAWIIYIHPDTFTGFDPRAKWLIMLSYLINNVFFPLLVVLLLRLLKFLPSFEMEESRDRIIPLVVTTIFFWWTYYQFRSREEIPGLLVDTCQGIFFSVSAALLFNAFFKISLHAMALGGFMGMLIVVLFSDSPDGAGVWLAVVTLLAGLIGTARLALGQHLYGDLLSGYVIGLLAQLAAHWVF